MLGWLRQNWVSIFCMSISLNAYDDCKTIPRSWMPWAYEVLDGWFFWVMLLSWLSSNRAIHPFPNNTLVMMRWWLGWTCLMLPWLSWSWFPSICDNLCSYAPSSWSWYKLISYRRQIDSIFHIIWSACICQWWELLGRAKLISSLSLSDASRVQWLSMLYTTAGSLGSMQPGQLVMPRLMVFQGAATKGFQYKKRKLHLCLSSLVVKMEKLSCTLPQREGVSQRLCYLFLCSCSLLPW